MKKRVGILPGGPPLIGPGIIRAGGLDDPYLEQPPLARGPQSQVKSCGHTCCNAGVGTVLLPAWGYVMISPAVLEAAKAQRGRRNDEDYQTWLRDLARNFEAILNLSAQTGEVSIRFSLTELPHAES